MMSLTEAGAVANRSWFSGCKSSMDKIAEAEKRILKMFDIDYTSKFVPIAFKQSSIYTITSKCESPKPKFEHPIVLVHGFGAGVALWGAAIKYLAKYQTVHAFDLLGFGASDRPKFSSDSKTAEQEMVDSIEMWREKMNIEKMNVVAHSFGGYLATSYAIKYPKRVNHLVLADPWGFNEKDPDFENRLSTKTRLLASVLFSFNPLAIVRVFGSYSTSLMRRIRPDLKLKYSEHVYDYVYHCNSRSPTGEAAFKSMVLPFAFPKDPMATRFLEQLDETVPVTFIHGERSWINRTSAVKLARERDNVNLRVMEGAGHHVYADDTATFTDLVVQAFEGSIPTRSVGNPIYL